MEISIVKRVVILTFLALFLVLLMPAVVYADNATANNVTDANNKLNSFSGPGPHNLTLNPTSWAGGTIRIPGNITDLTILSNNPESNFAGTNIVAETPSNPQPLNLTIQNLSLTSANGVFGLNLSERNNSVLFVKGTNNITGSLAGIYVPQGVALTVTSDSGGNLTVRGGLGCAGIGGPRLTGKDTGDIVVSGNVNINAYGGGGGTNNSTTFGGAAGIGGGGGEAGGNVSSIKINSSGKINAIGGSNPNGRGGGAGIGGGGGDHKFENTSDGGIAFKIEISGAGTIHATGGNGNASNGGGGAGIGGGGSGADSVGGNGGGSGADDGIKIMGNVTVTATGGNGGGGSGTGGNARSGGGGAGIGGGGGGHNGKGGNGTVQISDSASVTAAGGTAKGSNGGGSGAGIGGGGGGGSENVLGPGGFGTIKISDAAKVTAVSGEITDSGGGGNAAAIGGGGGNYNGTGGNAEVVISGGTVQVTQTGNGFAIGGGTSRTSPNPATSGTSAITIDGGSIYTPTIPSEFSVLQGYSDNPAENQIKNSDDQLVYESAFSGYTGSQIVLFANAVLGTPIVFKSEADPDGKFFFYQTAINESDYLEIEPPDNQFVYEGQHAVFSVVDIDGLGYQWQVDQNDGNGFSDVVGGIGETTANYQTPAAELNMNGWKYRAVINPFSTEFATLTVNEVRNSGGFGRATVINTSVPDTPGSETPPDSENNTNMSDNSSENGMGNNQSDNNTSSNTHFFGNRTLLILIIAVICVLLIAAAIFAYKNKK
ncbi:hypothetical protein [Methanolapillus millepedarum]|uniref:Uncharacterized protein n=1 Tax=Methanolapillus millepedarum TaxID=3028296 RepID=A0AA96V5Y2_9EURY|nr:hypothetical protein MsAc7_16720 [Methanosarcinaceae archaeon Ac7]